MNAITKIVKYACDMHDVAPFAGFSVSNVDFIAEPFGSAFLFSTSLRVPERSPG